MQAAAQHGHEVVVAQLLDRNPDVVNLGDPIGKTALHYAAQEGHERIVAQLLAANAIITKEDLFTAVESGHEKVVAQLLAHKPELIDAVDWLRDTLLHHAAFHGQVQVAAQLLYYKPLLIEATNLWGDLALWRAAKSGKCEVAELLLDRNPAHIFCVDKYGNSLLHHVLASKEFSDSFTRKVWGMNPEALHIPNRLGFAPPYKMMDRHGNKQAFEWLKWQMTSDEIVSVFATAFEEEEEEEGEARLSPRSLIVQQCQPLEAALLRDVRELVYEYLLVGTHDGKRLRKIIQNT